MNKKLAIRGHSTRGNEVIELLEMMGAVYCSSKIYALCENRCYSINDNGWIRWDYIGPEEIDKYEIFTLKEFLEKYPFKINDFVNIPEYKSKVCICGMRWDPTCQDVEYLVYCYNYEYWYTTRELLKYNNNPNKPSEDTEEKDKAKAPDIKGEDYSGKRFGYKIPDGYEFDRVENGKIILKPIKPKYPKTYEECAKIMNCPIDGPSGWLFNFDANIKDTYYRKIDVLRGKFIRLLICRDAYWKIYGEEMGLNRPWEPDWDDETDKFTISNKRNKIYLNNTAWYAEVLSFPTAEMRNAFYENFKDLIKQCKELL